MITTTTAPYSKEERQGKYNYGMEDTANIFITSHPFRNIFHKSFYSNIKEDLVS